MPLIFLRSRHPAMTISVAQKQAYDSEVENNFRWVFSLLATKSPRVLTSSDLVDEEVSSTISDIGQYAEIAHGSISPSFVFRHLDELCQPGQPLDDYDALRRDQARLVSHFKGEVANIQGYVAFRPNVRQLLISFSGTSSLLQALRDMEAWRTTYPRDATRSTVHAGFWHMYQGVRPQAYESLRLGFQQHGRMIEDLTLTGHSMGCAMCYLLALDLITEALHEEGIIPRGLKINIAAFGCPRLGNAGLATYWRKRIEEYINYFGRDRVVEYSIKGYNDGVHTIPPCFLGFRHLAESPLYFYHGRLYRIPQSENEHGNFTVERFANTANADLSIDLQSSIPTRPKESVAWPLGGHNYYNDRDMEKLQRHMRWLDVTVQGDEGWQDRFVDQSRKWEMRWGSEVNKKSIQK